METLFGNSVTVKVLDFLLQNRHGDHTKEEISRDVGVSRSQIHRIWSNVVGLELVIETRRIGRARLYRVNMESLIMKTLQRLSLELTEKTK